MGMGGALATAAAKAAAQKTVAVTGKAKAAPKKLVKVVAAKAAPNRSTVKKRVVGAGANLRNDFRYGLRCGLRCGLWCGLRCDHLDKLLRCGLRLSRDRDSLLCRSLCSRRRKCTGFLFFLLLKCRGLFLFFYFKCIPPFPTCQPVGIHLLAEHPGDFVHIRRCSWWLGLLVPILEGDTSIDELRGHSHRFWLQRGCSRRLWLRRCTSRRIWLRWRGTSHRSNACIHIQHQDSPGRR